MHKTEIKRPKKVLIHSLLAAGLLVLAVGATGCYATVGASAGYSDPDLVEIEPGVFVVENHGTAVFFSDGYYWRNTGGIWYRSSYYDSGFVRVSYGVPVRVRGIRRPGRYVHYRSRAGARRIRARARYQRANNRRNQRMQHRDNRRNQRIQHRDNRRDNRRGWQNNRRNQRQDRRVNRRDNRSNRRAAPRNNRAKRNNKNSRKSGGWNKAKKNDNRKKRRRH